MRFFAVLLGFVVLSQEIFSQGIHVQTMSEAGEALAGVNVWTFDAMRKGSAPQTDSDGRFVLPQEYSRFYRPGLEPVIRFSREGYKPVTKVVSSAQDFVVVLNREDQSVRTLDACDLKPSVFRWGAMGFVLPKGAKIKHYSGGDSWNSSIAYKRSSMGFGAGPSWSNGYPSWSSFYQNATQLREGEVRGRKGVWFAEYRGVRPNGTYFRWIGAFGITVSYDGVSKQAAVYFDQILDSLCWYPTR